MTPTDRRPPLTIEEQAAAALERSRREQGLPPRIEATAALAAVADIIRATARTTREVA